MGAVMDLFRVLFSPGEVFERVRERPKFLLPWIGLSIIIILVAYMMMPFTQAAIASRMAQIAQQNPQAAANAAKFQSIGIAFAPIFLLIGLLISAGLLWLLVMLLAGADAKFKTLLSLSCYIAVPTILLQVAGLIVLKMKGVDAVTSPDDLRPPLGLNLLAPGTGGFVGAFLAGINPFSLWAMFLTAIGIQVTHKTSKGAAYAVAIISTLLGVLIGSAFAGLGGGGK
jgi:hypothetical protein